MEDFEINQEYIQDLQVYQQEMKNRLILSNKNIQNYIGHLSLYYKLKISNEQSLKFGQQLKLLFLDQWGFYEDKNGIRTKENIQTLNIFIHLDEINNPKYMIGLKSLTNYFFVGLVNAIVETTETFFNLDFNETQLVIRSNESIEKSEFGMYLYMMYISDKYHKSLCIPTTPFDNLLQVALNIHNSFLTNTSQQQPDVILEIKRYYEYAKLNLINPNLYVFMLFTFSVIEAIKTSEITYDFNKDKLIVLLDESIFSCGKRFLMIPLTLELPEEETIHQNIILIDLETRKAERFEPHGVDEKTLVRDKRLNQHLVDWLKNYNISYNQKSYLGVQYFESFLPDFLRGKCLTLSFDYLKYRIEDLLEQDTAPDIYFNYVKERGLVHWKDICEKNNQIFEQLQIYLDILNQTFRTTLRFKGTMLTFRDHK